MKLLNADGASIANDKDKGTIVNNDDDNETPDAIDCTIRYFSI